ncbi:hypothetical protein [Gemmobacter aquaticus]|uniref:hypothetical protein n=1 Tax=Gemmobacter aquaticus TaxID=490185 RepID=UPI0013151198|nr:hypothetical protein [Gemmobacter aquaticus]
MMDKEAQNQIWIVSSETIQSVVASHSSDRPRLEKAMLEFARLGDPSAVIRGLLDYICSPVPIE